VELLSSASIMRTVLILIVGTFLPTAFGAVHNLFVGNLNAPANIHSLAFDDETNSFKIVKKMSADAQHAWIALSVSKYTSTNR
jgi:hypothetical protein